MEKTIGLRFEEILENFPRNLYPNIRPLQLKAFEAFAKTQGSLILELPTGAGKEAIIYTILKTLEKKGSGPLFWTTMTKSQALQLKRWYPELKLVYGRKEYPCLYYCPYHRGLRLEGVEKGPCTEISKCRTCHYSQHGKVISAEESPCSLLKNCPHRVDETGQTLTTGVFPCPYLWAKYEAKKGGIVVCTFPFYLFEMIFVKKWEKPIVLAVSEAHRTARITRGCLGWTFSDYHLKRIIQMVSKIGAKNEAVILQNLLKKMIQITKPKRGEGPFLLKDEEILELLDELLKIDHSPILLTRISEAVTSGLIDPEKDREILKKLETIAYEIPRYITNLEYSLATPERKPLSFTYGYYKKKKRKRERIRCEIGIQAHYVAPLIRKISPPLTIAYSATIGDPEIFTFENGFDGPLYSFPSDFPVKNTRIFLPTNTPDLAFRKRKKGDLRNTLKRIARSCKYLGNLNIRSLVLLMKEEERQKFLKYCQKLAIEYVTYDKEKSAREALEEFKKGKGQVLVGTVAQYGEGIDLPKQLAPVIFVLRPGYARPQDPATEFERKKRFSEAIFWSLQTWRVMIEALQVRGRNIRNPDDLGVTIFISQQFRRFLYPALPGWLKGAYVGNLKLKEALEEAVKLVSVNNLK